MTKPINSFIGPYRFLSNFFMVPIEIGSVEFPSSEHAYQAAKTKDKKMRKKIAQQKTPWEAKALGKKVKLREGWDERKVEVMYRVLRAKFRQHKDLREKLLATGDAELIEGNNWHDLFWGRDTMTDKGKNMLGRLLMLLRIELSS